MHCSGHFRFRRWGQGMVEMEPPPAQPAQHSSERTCLGLLINSGKSGRTEQRQNCFGRRLQIVFLQFDKSNYLI